MESHKAEVNPPPPLSSDALRLLYAIALYTDTAERSWLKEFTISVIAHMGVKRGVFTQYSLAPSLFSFRGVKMYAIVSQHALGDLDVFFRAGLVERILLNTQFYSQISALRLGPSSYLVLGEQGMLLISDDDSRIRDVLQGYSMMHNMTLLLSNVFSRIAWSWDCLNEQRRRIESGEAGNILDLQIRLSELTEQQGLLLTVPEQIRRDERHVPEWVEMTGVRARAEQLGIMAFAYMERL